MIYFKRIRLNVGADYARFQEFGSRGKTWRDIYSYGGDLLLDLNILRMSAAATATVKLSLYKPSEELLVRLRPGAAVLIRPGGRTDKISKRPAENRNV